MEQLGPFHIFFTLSCAEMRWPTVAADIFKSIGNGKIQIHYKDNWDGSAEGITVTQVDENGELVEIDGRFESTLPEYQKWYFEQKKISMTDFLKDHFVLITRIFDFDHFFEHLSQMRLLWFHFSVRFFIQCISTSHKGISRRTTLG